MLMWRLVTGTIYAASEAPMGTRLANTPNATLTWGPFKMPLLKGSLANGIAIAYLLIIFLFAFWPPALPVATAVTDYACPVFGETGLFSLIWYSVRAKESLQTSGDGFREFSV